jgi:hypothetical protein
MPQFLTFSEFVSATRILRPTVSWKIKTGEIPSTWIGIRILIPASFLQELEGKAHASRQPAEAQ